MYYSYRQPEEHGAYVTELHPEFPMPMKYTYLLLSVRERIAANLLQEALSGRREHGKPVPDIEKATTLHEFQRQMLTDFVTLHPPSPKTELQMSHILGVRLPHVIDK